VEDKLHLIDETLAVGLSNYGGSLLGSSPNFEGERQARNESIYEDYLNATYMCMMRSSLDEATS
jgi:hypothetical protein